VPRRGRATLKGARRRDQKKPEIASDHIGDGEGAKKKGTDKKNPGVGEVIGLILQ